MIWYPPILAYHRVLPEPGKETPGVTPEAFDRQMEILSKRWKPVSLAELVGRLGTRRPYQTEKRV